MHRHPGMLAGLLAALLLTPALARAEALPVFSESGPDAEAYGQAEHYPIGAPGHLREQRFLVGSLSHFDHVLSSNPVARAAQASHFARADEELTLTYRHRGESHTLADYLERQPATGLLILKGDTILFEHYRYARTDRDRFTSQSMAKTITAMLVGIAVAEGAIKSIDDPAADYVPELAGSEFGRTPIRALLHMASGIAFSETYDGTDDSARFNRELWRHDGRGDAAAIMTFNNRTAAPDSVWHYAGINTQLLGLVLARAVKQPLATYLERHIWQRIGSEADATWVVDASGQEAAFCCFNAVLRDWGRLGLLLANDGAWHGEQLIPRQWVIDATTAAPAGNFLASGTATSFFGYGYQVWILPGPRREFALLGIHGQAIFVDPAAKLVLVHTAVRPKPTGNPGQRELVSLWQGLVEQYGAEEGDISRSLP
ncbi:MAG TPA: serine hydrolase [Alphaproteobacteria bacterium]|nr:serine hydrolase [Alphaproteobacteria bacterium]